MTLSSSKVEKVLRQCLLADDYQVSPPQGKHAVSLVARKGSERIEVEVIGYSPYAPKRAHDFFEVVFRAIFRLNGGAERIVIACPVEFERGLRRRAEHYGEAWERIGAAFPELEIWIVDRRGPAYRCTKFVDWVDLPRAEATPVLQILNAQVVGPQRLVVEFNDGTAKRVDLSPLLNGPVFEPLRDPAFFARVTVDPVCKTVVWPNGADLAPEALYELAPCEAA